MKMPAFLKKRIAYQMIALVVCIYFCMVPPTAEAKVSSRFTGAVLTAFDTTCNSTTGGALRYNTSSLSTDYCNGTVWISLTTTANAGGTAGWNGGILLKLTNGTAAAPSLTFLNDATTGLFYNATTFMTVTTNGVQRAYFDASGNFNLAAPGQYQVGGVPLLFLPHAGADPTSVAMGLNALSNPTANNHYNTAIGTGAGQYIKDIGDSTAIGNLAAQGVSGTPPTNASVSAIGDSTMKTVQGAGGTLLGVGYQAATNPGNAGNETAVGYMAMHSGVPSDCCNTAVGAYALYTQNIHPGATAIGAYAAYSNVSAYYHTAVGYGALRNSLNESTALGYQAAYNYTCCWGTAAGTNAMLGNPASFINGNDNTAIGDSALYSVGGTTAGNLAIGYQALYATTTGSNNTAIGYQAGYAGTPNTTGASNTFIGYQAQASAAGYTNSTALGNGAAITASHVFVLGNLSVSAIYAQVTTITAISDRREKKDIKDLPGDLGLDFITKLRPVSYRYNNGDETLRYGFIAQDMEQALPKSLRSIVEKSTPDHSLSLIERQNNKERTYRVNYYELLAPVVHSVQEQQKQIEDARKELDAARQEYTDLNNALDDNAQAIATLNKDNEKLDRMITEVKEKQTKGKRP